MVDEFAAPSVWAAVGRTLGWQGSAAANQSCNARGGVRLPHIAVPLGTYGGYDTDPVAAYLPFFGAAVFLGGKFTPFPESVLRQRYPNHGAYVRAVAHAANEALRNRWITEEDRDGYVTEAARSRVRK